MGKIKEEKVTYKKQLSKKTFTSIVNIQFKVKGRIYKVGDKFTTKDETLYNNLINFNKINNK